MMENKIAIIGDKDLVEGFAVAGFYIFSPTDEREAIASSLDEIIKNNFSICFILEKYALKIKEQIWQLQERVYPVIVVIPDYRRDFDLTTEFLKEIVVRAIGTESIESIER